MKIYITTEQDKNIDGFQMLPMKDGACDVEGIIPNSCEYVVVEESLEYAKDPSFLDKLLGIIFNKWWNCFFISSNSGKSVVVLISVSHLNPLSIDFFTGFTSLIKLSPYHTIISSGIGIHCDFFNINKDAHPASFTPGLHSSKYGFPSYYTKITNIDLNGIKYEIVCRRN